MKKRIAEKVVANAANRRIKYRQPTVARALQAYIGGRVRFVPQFLLEITIRTERLAKKAAAFDGFFDAKGTNE